MESVALHGTGPHHPAFDADTGTRTVKFRSTDLIPNKQETMMSGLHALDRVIGNEWPTLATQADVQAFESVPYVERIAARSTYEALRCGASIDPATPALLFLPNASADDEPLRLSHRSSTRA
jgi:hypothetical protein